MKEHANDLVSNRRAFHNYEILETFEAGLALVGTEVKSLRSHGGSLQEAYVTFLKGELWLLHCTIVPYAFGNIHNHEERRPRKLLMHKREIERLQGVIRERGMALVPLALYLKRGRVKLRFGVGKGKKAHDKREAIRKRDEERSLAQALRRRH